MGLLVFYYLKKVMWQDHIQILQIALPLKHFLQKYASSFWVVGVFLAISCWFGWFCWYYDGYVITL